MNSIDTATAATAAGAEAAPSNSVASPRKAKRASDFIPAASPAPNPTSKPTSAISKSAAVLKLLSRTKGATVEELMTETSWQPHSVRAFFSGLRKKGHALVREQRKDGTTCYRLAAAAVEATTTAPILQPTAATQSPEVIDANGAAA